MHPALETITITLRKPVKLGDQEWLTFDLREPTAAEWTRWDKLDGVEADIMAIAVVSGVPEAAIRQIGTRDLVKASRFIAGFLVPDQETGANA